MTTATAAHTAAKPKLPNALHLGVLRGRSELVQFFRDKPTVVFTFALPSFLLILLASLFNHSYGASRIPAGELLAASMMGAGIISTSFTSLGTAIAIDRENGTLKRLRGTPMPASSYFIGKIILVAVASFAEAVLMLIIATVFFHLQLPTAPEKWLTLVWVFLLGVTSSALIGIALSSLVRSVAAATAIANLSYIGLQFISGVFVAPITALPKIVVEVASFFPVKWICQGFRSVFLPEDMASLEMAGKWELGKVALVLGAWCVVGLLVCRLTFRWGNEDR